MDDDIESILYIAREISGLYIALPFQRLLTSMQCTESHHSTRMKAIARTTGVTLQRLYGKAD
jgi:hypothetical protein